ncbi:hypothetical protein [Mycolicibacterium smegmatis]|uniref:hypothetical protein n=1 Tax=Mycolicibacterium smegmatis TaxID=1772 RepID=UPI001303C4BB|nr:hypothetical protein [Mycolicibacterium smegmatis]
MAEPISGKVAAIENNYSVVINRGSKHEVKNGMIFLIEDPQGQEIPDPDDPNEILGYLPVAKIRVKVFDVQEKFCRAETFVRVKPETAYEQVARELLDEYRTSRRWSDLRSLTMPYQGPNDAQAKLQQALHLLQVGAATRSGDERPAVVEVNVGDIARQVG